MRCVLIIAVTMACFASPVSAQQGPAYTSPGASRGHAFPKHVSPTQTNPTNWVARKPEYTDPYGPNSKRYYRSHHYYYRHHHHHYR